MANLRADDLASAVVEILNKYEKATEEALKKATDTAAKEVVNELKRQSPKNTGAYAASWKQKKDPYMKGAAYGKIAYNEEHYRLTHLLEFGYPLKNGGRYRAKPHIKDAEQNGIANFERLLRENIENDT